MRNHLIEERSLSMMVDENKKKERIKDCRGIENSTEKEREARNGDVYGVIYLLAYFLKLRK